jgi:hypothetical protein
MWLRKITMKLFVKPLNAELNPICHLLALLGAHHILHVSRIRVKFKHNNIVLFILNYWRQGSVVRPSSGQPYKKF